MGSSQMELKLGPGVKSGITTIYATAKLVPSTTLIVQRFRNTEGATICFEYFAKLGQVDVAEGIGQRPFVKNGSESAFGYAQKF